MHSIDTVLEDTALAIDGGKPVRTQPMPVRHAFGSAEKQSIYDMIAWYEQQDTDPCYQGHFEQEYCKLFEQMHGGGYADAVATGTTSLYVALAALNLPKNSEVLVSPITDPGTLSAIILLGLKPRLIDTKPFSYNTDAAQLEARISPNTHCALIVHAAGQALDMTNIMAVCKKHNIKVLEDCSQAHMAKHNGQLVGTFGDIAAFSTMYRKASTTGPTGGVVYSTNLDLARLALAHADRGKPSWIENFDDRNPQHFLFPAFNLHSNEFAAAIGLASLKRLPDTISKRLNFVNQLSAELKQVSKVCTAAESTPGDSPFYLPIFVNTNLISCSKTKFAEAIRAEGIGLNPHYQYRVAGWDWIQPYLADDFNCPNAKQTIDNSFCLYLNECYGTVEVKDTIKAILKVERFFSKE